MKKVTIEFRHQILVVDYNETKRKALLNAIWDRLEALGIRDISRIRDDSQKRFIVEYADDFNEPVVLIRSRRINPHK